MTEATDMNEMTEESVQTAQEQNENQTFTEEKYRAEDSATKRYSERLNKDRAKIREEFEAELDPYRDMENSLRALGYEGNNAAELNSSLKAKLEQENSEADLPDDPIIFKALDIAMMYKRAKDLDEIKKIYPECNATDSRNIGDIFTKIMQTGQIDAVTAYEAQMAYNKRNTIEQVSSMGSVKANEIGYEKDYYTPEEAAKLTRKDYDRNPGLWEKVRKSMLEW